MAAVATESKVVAKAEVERSVVALDDYADLINEYAEVRDLRNELDKKVKALNTRLDEIMGDAEAGTVGGRVRITVTEVERTGVDTEMLDRLFPEAAEATRKVTRYKKRNLK